MPSIHPQQNATSSACAAVTDGSPEPFLWIFSQISVSRVVIRRSHFSNAASVREALDSCGIRNHGRLPKLRTASASESKRSKIGEKFGHHEELQDAGRNAEQLD